uniref:Uncharacterized protein n=1 Tax=Haptolina ericina TaxID=156174 RepID=A0A7S3AK06_9EUKA|mmetsp:Transcript_21317/g.47891  ORF Transcript_21317/g.47891 Transcript_21317/m.47891 type:complete len:202 (+) Transcript_21317:329-934(+)
MNELWDPGLVSLSSALSRGAVPRLKRLDLSSNHIGQPFISDAARREQQSILDAVPEHDHHLIPWATPDLSQLPDGAVWSDCGIKALGDAVVSHGALEHLQTLQLDHNGLTDASVQAFCSCLLAFDHVLLSLRFLDLSHNSIGPSVIRMLVGALRTGSLPGCTEISLDGNQVPSAMVAELRDAICSASAACARNSHTGQGRS